MTLSAKRFVVASLVYFVLGLVAQVAAVFDVWLGFNPLAYTTITATQQFLLLGWLTQIALALVYDRWLVNARSRLALAILILFNLGLPLTIIGQPGLAIFGRGWIGALATCGAGLQLLAAIIFVREAWIYIQQEL
jgi:hypothetical protein